MVSSIINIQSSNKCNASCKCCDYVDIYGGKQKNDMSDEVWGKIIEGLEYTSPSVPIIFGALDEPLLDTKLFDRLSQLQSMGVTTGIVTNCSLLCLNTVKDLYSLGVRLFNLSLLSPKKEEFEELTGLKYNVVVFNILRACHFLLEKRDAAIGIPAAVENSTMEEYTELLGDYSKYVRLYKRDNRVKQYKKETIHRSESGCGMYRGRTNHTVGCDVGYNKLYIRWNGDVDLCILDSKGACIVGSILDTSIVDIIESKKRILRNIKSNTPECCKNCYM